RSTAHFIFKEFISTVAYLLPQFIIWPQNHVEAPTVRLSSIRAIIERAFARLKGKFRRLKYLDIADPNFRVDIITAACVLHNFILTHDNDNEEFEVEEEPEEDED
ncbi:unnamed protein product, partial [Tenebrio molitor]